MRRLIIRADAGESVGFGHVVRSLSLAEFLRENYGIRITFYSNPYTKLKKMCGQHGFECVFNDGLSEAEFLRKIGSDDPESVVLIDNRFPYSSDDIHGLGSAVRTIMLGNACDGMHECDYTIFPSGHLDGHAVLEMEQSRGRARLLYGLDYVIIGRSVIDSRNRRRDVGSLAYVAIVAGASDPVGILTQTLRLVNESDLDIPVKALYGFDFCHRAELESLLPELRPGIEAKAFNYDDLFSSRLALSAFGITTYELIYAGIPVVTVGHIRANDLGGRVLQRRYGCNHHLGLFQEVGGEQLISCIQDLWDREDGLAAMRQKQAGLIDGRGLERIGQIVYSCCSD